MALHMIPVRIRPAAPTREPEMIRALFPTTKPVALAATPESEFRNEITTGMSAPPIGATKATPSRQEVAVRAINQVVLAGSPSSMAAETTAPARSRALTAFPPGRASLSFHLPESFSIATTEPVRVVQPIRLEAPTPTRKTARQRA